VYIHEFVTDLARALRRRGLRVGVSETMDACNALLLLRGLGPEDLLTAIKVTMIKDPSMYHLAEQAIQEAATGGGAGGDQGGGEGGEGLETHASMISQARRAGREQREGVSTQFVMYSPAESLHRRSLRPIDVAALRAGKRIIRRMRRRLAVLPGRRSRSSRKGELEFARTIRHSFRTFGEIIELKKSAKALSRARLVTLIDVSGSMDSYTDWLVRAMYLFSRFTRRVEVFVFSTRLKRVTELLSVTDPEEVRRRLSNEVELWGSGTRIGYSLKCFMDSHGEMLNRSWIVVIVSDGWDTGEPELLRMSLMALRQRAGRIIWLNPHTDRPNFRPLTVGMLTALPYIDVLAGLSVMENYASFLTFFGKSIKPLKRGVSLVRYPA